jgi:beta-glucosidase
MVTFYHFSSPKWFAGMGGWERSNAGDLFVRYCERAAKHLGSLVDYATTFNEPNLPMLLKWVSNIPIPFLTVMRMRSNATRSIGSNRFGCFFLGDAHKLQDGMIEAHIRARDAIKSGPGEYPVGVNLALQDEQAVATRSKRDRKCAEVYEPWLAAAGQSDFLGVQTYTRCRVGKNGDLPPEPGADLTQLGYEFCPEALDACIRYASGRVRVPIYITENGVAVADDTRRVEYIRRALTGVLNCLEAGIDVRGYIHWSLLDNFEWIFGYHPKFGIVSVNRETQQRLIKPSGRYLGEIAQKNRIPDLVVAR